MGKEISPEQMIFELFQTGDDRLDTCSPDDAGMVAAAVLHYQTGQKVPARLEEAIERVWGGQGK